tara:strand:- start:200 stop:367 length:168 start_codon:yes stop_codon:yes gene_type:complete
MVLLLQSQIWFFILAGAVWHRARSIVSVPAAEWAMSANERLLVTLAAWLKRRPDR